MLLENVIVDNVIKKCIFVLGLQSVGNVVERLSGYQNLFDLFKKNN